jgi:hypothetical protein
VAVLALSAQLTPTERDALQKAVSADHLDEQGLKEGSHGEILNKHGRRMFEIGFAWAIRKVLGDWPGAPVANRMQACSCPLNRVRPDRLKSTVAAGQDLPAHIGSANRLRSLRHRYLLP